MNKYIKLVYEEECNCGLASFYDFTLRKAVETYEKRGAYAVN